MILPATPTMDTGSSLNGAVDVALLTTYWRRTPKSPESALPFSLLSPVSCDWTIGNNSGPARCGGVAFSQLRELVGAWYSVAEGFIPIDQWEKHDVPF